MPRRRASPTRSPTPAIAWHANQMARYNLLRGLCRPSGDWHNNPDADDIDFQIEADLIGLMPGCRAPRPASPTASATS